MLVMLAGTVPRNLIFFANLRHFSAVPWAVPLVAGYIWFFWQYLSGKGPPESTAIERRASLRANRISSQRWAWSLIAGTLSIVALVLGLMVMNRMAALPQQQVPAEFTQIPKITVVSLLLMSAPVAGIIEESAFRGYMQGPLERSFGVPLAILITGTMFAVAHLDFTPILWPYYVAVAAIYGVVTNLTQSILPAIVLHTAGNVYSNLDLWLYGRAEWQASANQPTLIWNGGPDASFWMAGGALIAVSSASVCAFRKLARLR